jgi:hypothetical protein
MDPLVLIEPYYDPIERVPRDRLEQLLERIGAFAPDLNEARAMWHGRRSKHLEASGPRWNDRDRAHGQAAPSSMTHTPPPLSRCL